MGLELHLLSIDQGIVGYRDFSLDVFFTIYYFRLLKQILLIISFLLILFHIKNYMVLLLMMLQSKLMEKIHAHIVVS